MKDVWVALKLSGNTSSSTGAGERSAEDRSSEMVSIESCQEFLVKLNKGCVAFLSWADNLEENCCPLNDEIAKDKERERDRERVCHR